MKVAARSVITALGISLVVCLPHGAVGAGAISALPALDNTHAHPPVHVRGNATISPSGYAPDQIRRAYGFDRVRSDGTSQIIGLVDAFDDPTIASDLQSFVTAFGLRPMNGLPGAPACTIVAGPHPCFQKIYAQGTPRSSGNWLLETSLDVEWAHAIAPAADVLLVEAVNDTYPNLLGAVDVAVTNGARTVSMSWGGPEFVNETHDDRHFNKAGVTFTTSSGDSGTGVQYPAASPYVVAVGGTTLPLERAGVLTAPESAWSGSGGGISAYESAPGYQGSYGIPPTGGKRGVPDVAYNADPNTGIAVYGAALNQGQPGWLKVGGTSAGAPQWAALVALANQGRANGTLSSSDTDRSPFYTAAVGVSYASNYRDITVGSNGSCGNLCSAGLGYDFVAGLGGPQAAALVPFLNTH